MYFEKQILGVLRNEVGPDACDNVVLVGDMNLTMAGTILSFADTTEPLRFCATASSIAAGIAS